MYKVISRRTRKEVVARFLGLVMAIGSAAFVPSVEAQPLPPASKTHPILTMPARGASVVVKVEQYENARQVAMEVAKTYGADLIEQRTQVTNKGRQHGYLQFRLKADALPAFLTRVRGLGTLAGERVSTVDHGSEAASLTKRVQRLQEHETRLDSILNAPRKLRGSDVLYVQERLFRASVDQSLLTQRREDLERDAQQCDVVLTLFEPIPVTQTARVQRDVTHSFSEGVGYAKATASTFAARTLTVLAYGAVFAPLWVSGLLMIALTIRQVRRRWHRQSFRPIS